MKTDSSLFTIYSRRLAGYLMMNGFPIVRIMQNSKTGSDNYLFPNTEALHYYINKWQTEKVKENSINNSE